MIILCFAVVVAVKFCDDSYRLNFCFVSETPRHKFHYSKFLDRPYFLGISSDSETLVCNVEDHSLPLTESH